MGGGELLAAALLLFDPVPRRRRTRAERGADCCDEIPTRLSKGETETTADKLCACAEAGAQVCDGRYASTYQLAHCSVLPTSPPIDLPEFPLQRSEPCRTQGNFEVGSVYEVRSRSPSPSSYGLRKASPNRGSPHSSRPDKEGGAFASSLRKYATAPDRPPTMHDLQKLIKEAQKKYSAKITPASKKTLNVEKKPSPVSVHGNRSSKNLQTYTRSRNASPKNEVKPAPKKGRSGYTSPSPQCSREVRSRTASPKNEVKPAPKKRRSGYASPSPQCSREVRSRTASPKNEVKPAPKKGRSGYTSLSPQCSREVRANDMFDYLSSDVQAARAPASGDRVRDSIGNSLRQVFGDPRGPVTVMPVCPKILSRLEQHRREHHVCHEPKSLRVDQACGSTGILPWSSNCGPPEASTSCSIEKLLVCCTCNDPVPCDCKPPICLCRELRQSEDELQERRRLQEIVSSWLDDLPVSAKEKPQDKFIRDALIRKLIDTLAAMNDEEFDAKGRDEIEKCVNGMPMWYPHDKKERDQFKNDLVDNLFDRIKGFRKRDRFKDAIAKWLDTIEFTEDLNKDEVIDNFSNALKEIALNRPTNDGIYRDKLKTKILDMLGALPVAATVDKEGFVNLRAEQLADQLVRLPKSAVKPDSYFKSESEAQDGLRESERQLEQMAAYARQIADREFGAIILKALDEVDGLRALSLEKKEIAIKEMVPKLPNLLTDDEDYAAKETYDHVHDFVVKLAGENGVFLDDRAKVEFIDKLVDNLEETFAHHLEVGESLSQFLTDLPKPPKPTALSGQPGDQKQLDKPHLRDNSINVSPYPTEESQRPGTDRRGQTSSPQRPTDKRRLSGQISLEDGRSPIATTTDGKRGTIPQRPTDKRKISGQSYLGDEGSPTQRSTDGKRSPSPEEQTNKRRLGGQSYLEDEGSPTERSTDGKRSPSPKRQTDKRGLDNKSYLEEEFSPTQRSTDGKRGYSPQRPTDKRKLSGQSYLGDEGSPTQRSTDSKRSPSPEEQTNKRRLGGQSYLEDEGSPTERSTDGKRSPSPKRQTDKRGLDNKSYLEDELSPTQRSTDGKRSPSPEEQTNKRRLGGQSYLEDEGSPTERSTDGKRSPSPKRQTDKRGLDNKSYLEDELSPTQRSTDGKRSPSPEEQTNKRRLGGQSYLEDEGSPTQRSTDGKRSPSSKRQTDKRGFDNKSYLEDEFSPTQRSTDGKRGYSPQNRTDKRRLSGQSYLVDESSPTERSTDGKRSPSPKRQTDKRGLDNNSYLEEEFSPTQRSTDGKRGSSLQRQTDKRRLSGQSYLEDEGSPTKRSTDGKRSPSPKRQTEKHGLDNKNYLEDEFSPTQRSTDIKRGHSPQKQTDKRRLSGQSYLQDEGSPTERSTDGKRSSSPKRQTDKRGLDNKSYLEEEFSPTQRSTDGKRGSSPQRQTDKHRLSGQSYLEDEGSPTERSTDVKRSLSSKRQTDKRGLDNKSYLEDEFSPTQRSTDGKRGSSPQRQTDKRRLSAQSYLEDGGSPVMQGGVDGSRISSPQGQSTKRRPSGQSYLDDGSPISQRPGYKRRESDQYDDNTSLRTYNDSSPSQSYKRRASAKVEDEGSPTSQRSYGKNSPSKAYPGEKTPLTPSIIDIEYPSNISKRGNIEDRQRPLSGGYGKPRSEQRQFDETGFNSAPLGGKSLATDIGKRQSQPGEGRPVDAMGYLSDRDEFKDKGGIKSKGLASKQGQGRDEPQFGRENFDKTEPRKQGLSRFDYEQDSQAHPEPRRRSIDTTPGDNSRYLVSDQQNKADSRRPSLLSGPTNISQRNDNNGRQSNQTSGGGTSKSSGQQYVSGKPQSDDKRRASFNASYEDDFSDQRSRRPTGTKVKPHMKEDGEKTVKRMKSFLSRYRTKFGLKKPPGLDEQDAERTADHDEDSYNQIDEPFDLSAEGLKQPFARRRVSFTSDENLLNSTDNDPMLQKSIRNNARDVLNQTGANITNMSEVELKLGELLEDLVMRGLDEDSAREQLFSVLGPEVSMEEAEEIFNALMERANEMSASVDPDMTPRFKTGPSATSTPRKDRQDEEDKFGNKLLTDKEREQEWIRKQAESDYNEELAKKITSWMNVNNILKSDAERNSVARDLAGDFVDRQKYLQLNPGAKTSSAEELEHMKYQVFKRINKLLDPDEVDAAISKVPRLMKSVKEVPVPQLTKGPPAMSGCNDVVTKWCQKLPIPNTEQGMKTKQEMANNIMAKIGELNINPQILNDDILYDDILGDLLDEQLKAIPGIDDKEQLKTELLEEVKKLREPLQKKMAGQLYNEKLRDTIPKTLPPIDKENKAEEASFEIMKDNLADAYINLHYVGGDSALREKFKNKINDEINKFANNYLERHPNEPLSTSQLKKDLYSALKKVDVPGDESMRSEVERVRMKDLIDEWAKELPMKTQTPEQLLHTNKVLKAMTQRLLDLERENQLNPTDDYDDKLEKEIKKYAKKLPVQDNANVNAQNKRLIKKIKDTEHSRTFTEGSRRSVDFDGEDRNHLQGIRDRSGRSASMSGLCQNCKSFIMQNSRSCVRPCRDAAVSPPPIDRCSQTDMTVKLNQYAQCKCSAIQAAPPAPLPCPSRSRSHVSIPCNTPRPRVSTGSQVHINPYILVDEYRWDTPRDQVTERPSHPCISSQSIPTCEPRGTITPEPCYTTPCRAKVTKLGSFNSSEYNRGSCTPPTRRKVVRDINDTQCPVPSTEPCHQHTPRKVWSRPRIYRDTCVPKDPVKCACRGQVPKCSGQVPKCSGRRHTVNCHTRTCHNDPLKACHKCCAAKCPHPTHLFFK